MDRFQEMRVFVRIAERHSFSLAADDLQIPRATVTPVSYTHLTLPTNREV